MIALHPETMTVLGFEVALDRRLGHLMVGHDGTISWEQLQAVKNAVWGESARAIEVYPVQASVVNSGNWRHLWKLGPGDFCPDLLDHESGDFYAGPADLLEFRHAAAWAEAKRVFRGVRKEPDDAPR